MPDNAEQFHRLSAALADRYRIDRELGRGGMATVYLAEDLKNKRQVAIKVLKPEIASVVGPDRFLREIAITANLNHPHILPLHDSGEADGQLFYVMPLVEGESLRDRLNREKQLPVDDALQIARDVASALDYAHSHDVIHRDIKPENVLLEAGGAVVADFGIARAISEAGGDRITETGMAIGTPAYMSPEQAAGNSDVDQRSDVYSLACVTYEMLAGEPPFTGPSAEVVLRKQIAAEAPSLRVSRPNLSDAVSGALHRGLAKSPADRFASAGELAATLTAAGRLSNGFSTNRWRRAGGRILVLVSIGVLTVAAFTMWAVRLGSAVDLVPNRVVVVPFENRTADASFDDVGIVAADWIANGLAGLGRVEVIPPIDASRSLQSSYDSLAHTTRSGMLVRGSYHGRGSIVEFQAQLVSTKDGSILAAIDPTSAPLEDPMAAVERLRVHIMGAVASRLDFEVEGASSPLARAPAITAYQAFVEAQQHVVQLEWEEAERDLKRAIALDSLFSPPYMWLAGGALHNQRKWREADSIVQLLERRIRNPTPLERSRMTWLKAFYSGDQLGALSELRRLAQVWPGAERYHVGWQALQVNRPREAIGWFERIPDNWWRRWGPYWSFLASAHHMLGQHEQELKVAKEAHGLHGDNMLWLEARAHIGLGDVARVEQVLEASHSPSLMLAWELRAHGYTTAATRLAKALLQWLETSGVEATDPSVRRTRAEAMLLLGRADEAKEIFRDLLSLDSHSVLLKGLFGVAAAAGGNRTEAQMVSDELSSMDGPYLWGKHLAWSARIEAALGERDRAVQRLRQAFAEGLLLNPFSRGTDYHAVWLDAEPEFESLRDYQPFQDLLRPEG